LYQSALADVGAFLRAFSILAIFSWVAQAFARDVLTWSCKANSSVQGTTI